MSIALFSTDLDGTLVGNPEATSRFAAAWEALPKDKRPVLVYNSGRLVEEVFQVVDEQQLPMPDFVVGGVGTEIVETATKQVLNEYQQEFFADWNHDDVERFLYEYGNVQHQPEQFQSTYKSSWYLQNATREDIDTIREGLSKVGLRAMVVYSSARDLDVLPAHATKGNALSWLLQRLNIAAEDAVVAGDSGNDVSMYQVPGVHGILVENARPELHEACVKLESFHAGSTMADGVIEGLVHFNVFSADQANSQPAPAADSELTMLFDPKSLKGLDAEQQALLETAYEKAIDAVHRCVTPMGFAACSIDDNESTGTDANYHSVWARDGSITVSATRAVDDPIIRACQRNTLSTLLDAITPSGQLPANVRVANKEPDYSGVGGICSIDSGLWVIIGVYHYVTASGDMDFLEQYADHLDKAMFWLGCHDSNNDGLLEIPEASDWTDLFGRSYQVLYDEVLWYRANVCYARLLEARGQYDRAVEVLQRSQYIQGKLIVTFWPSTSGSSDPAFAHTFADRQYSLGDVQYLLAEVTPFNFNWRCDVYGNILAFLTNVIDVQRARTAFRFMWGAGVNRPWPVANLYPVVQAGDPDWRPYYTVNLLNIPHHYHNGGAWPLIGGMWVRFIERLGQHDVACQELVRLAELCRRGVKDEWEFTEWAHGETGLPIGKRYQAWSAASFIRACHDLGTGGASSDFEHETGLFCRLPNAKGPAV